MDLSAGVRAVLRGWWVWVLSTLLVGGAMFAYSSAQTPQYRSTAQVYVTVTGGKASSDLSQGAAFVQAQVASYAQLVTSPIVLDPVARQIGVPGGAAHLESTVSASSSKETVIISITADDPEPTRAAMTSEALAEQLGVAVRGLSPRDDTDQPMIKTVVISNATPPTSPSSPRVTRDTAAAALAGLVLGVLAAGAWGLRRQRLARVATAVESTPVEPTPAEPKPGAGSSGAPRPSDRLTT